MFRTTGTDSGCLHSTLMPSQLVGGTDRQKKYLRRVQATSFKTPSTIIRCNTRAMPSWRSLGTAIRNYLARCNNGRTVQNFLPLNGRPPAALYENAGLAAELSASRKRAGARQSHGAAIEQGESRCIHPPRSASRPGHLSDPTLKVWTRSLGDVRRSLRLHQPSGFIDGKNVLFESYWANGQFDRLPALAADLVGRKPEVIVTQTLPGALAAKASTGTIPIVFVIGEDPIAVGLVASLGRPDGNVTGMTNFIFLLPGEPQKR